MFCLVGKQAEEDSDGIIILQKPRTFATESAKDFNNNFMKKGGIEYYMFDLQKCKKPKKCGASINPAELNQQVLRKILRGEFKKMISGTNCRAVPYTNYSSWEYEFTGIPNNIDFANFSYLQRHELDAIAKSLNEGKIKLRKSKNSNKDLV